MTHPITPDTLVSDCHKAPMRVVGGGEGTNHYECTECGESCNWVDTNSGALEQIFAEYIDDRGNTNYLGLEAAINQYMLDTFMELIDGQYELSIADLELRNYQDGVETPVLSKKQLRKAAQEKLKP